MTQTPTDLTRAEIDALCEAVVWAHDFFTGKLRGR